MSSKVLLNKGNMVRVETVKGEVVEGVAIMDLHSSNLNYLHMRSKDGNKQYAFSVEDVAKVEVIK